MSVETFIPEIWSANLLSQLDGELVYGRVVNRDYEGEISQYGDVVRINQLDRPTLFDYTANQDMPDPEVLSGSQQQLVIDQQKGFNFLIDDIDDAQTKPKLMGEVTQAASYVLARAADQYVAGFYTSAANTVGSDAAPVTPDATTAYELLVDAGTTLDDSNVPMSGRWAVVPPWYAALLAKDQRFTDASASGTTQTLRNGEVGNAAGFTLYKSTGVPSSAGAAYKIMCGHPMAISYAEQITSTEAYRPPSRFADALKGLHTYGCKVLQPDALVVITADKPAA